MYLYYITGAFDSPRQVIGPFFCTCHGEKIRSYRAERKFRDAKMIKARCAKTRTQC
jgi:hypothetical protein